MNIPRIADPLELRILALSIGIAAGSTAVGWLLGKIF